MAAVYRFADRDIAILPGHEEIHELCRDYAADATPLFAVETNRADIKFERVRSARRDIAKGHPVHAYTDACLETLAVLRKIAERMPE